MKLFYFLSVLNVLKILLTFCLEGLSVSTDFLFKFCLWTLILALQMMD